MIRSIYRCYDNRIAPIRIIVPLPRSQPSPHFYTMLEPHASQFTYASLITIEGKGAVGMPDFAFFFLIFAYIERILFITRRKMNRSCSLPVNKGQYISTTPSL